VCWFQFKMLELTILTKWENECLVKHCTETKTCIIQNTLDQGWANFFYRGQLWRFFLLPRAACSYCMYFIYNRFENYKKVLHELPQNENNDSHFGFSKIAISNQTCGKKTWLFQSNRWNYFNIDSKHVLSMYVWLHCGPWFAHLCVRASR